jgi:hypothetical protein
MIIILSIIRLANFFQSGTVDRAVILMVRQKVFVSGGQETELSIINSEFRRLFGSSGIVMQIINLK